MRLVLVVDTFPAPSETFIMTKLRGLLARGVDVQVAALRLDEGAWRELDSSERSLLQGRAHLLPTLHHPWAAATAFACRLAPGLLREPRRAPAWARAAARRGPRSLMRSAGADGVLAALRPDVLHFEFGHLGELAETARQVVDCPVTLSVRGWDLNFWRLDDPAAYERVWPHVDALHCLGQDLWSRARARGAPADLPVVFIPPGVDTAFFDPARHRPHGAVAPPGRSAAVGTAAAPLRLLAIGRLHWKKGHEWALAALAELRRRGVVADLRLAGSGPDEPLVRAAVASLGLEGCVSLLGHRGPADVRAELAAADVLVHAAVSEGFANSVLEAQAMAVPVVCSDADGLAENVADGVTGFVVGRRDPAAMADRLQQLAADGELRRALGAAGRERVLRHFALHDQLDAIEGFYADALAGRFRRRPAVGS